MEPCALNGFYSPAQRARFLAAVSRRASVRKYSGSPDIAQKSALQYATGRICLPGVRLELCEGEPERIFRRLPVVGGVTGTGCCAAPSGSACPTGRSPRGCRYAPGPPRPSR